MAEWLRGGLATAERALVPSIAGWADRPVFVAWGRHLLGQIQRAQGRLDAAVQTYQQAQEATAGPGRTPLPAAGVGYVGLAEVARQRDELDAALEQVTEGVELCRQLPYVSPLAARPGDPGLGPAGPGGPGRGAGSDAGSRADLAGARRSARPGPGPAGQVAGRPGRPALRRPVDRRTRPARGRRAGLRARAGAPGAGPAPARRGPARPGARAARPLAPAAMGQERTGSVIETGALRALAHAASGRESEAITILAGTLTLAGQQGHVRVFADEGPPMAALLGGLIAAQRADQTAARIPLAFLARLQRAFGDACPAPATRPARTPPAPGLIDPLTGRELEVLRLVAAGRSNQDIARELVVTLDTVKKHVSHILGKLGGSNRTEAVSRARELDLIS